MTESISFIPSRVKNCAEGGHVAGARDIIDDGSGMTLDELVGNKEYAPTDFSGMGRVVLKKNMVNDANTLTQDMFYKDGDNDTRVPNTNTIFVIQYDFTLGEDITIPANCVLQFDGGSLNNGTINLNGCYINAGLNQIFNNVKLNNINTYNDALGVIDNIYIKAISSNAFVNKKTNTLVAANTTINRRYAYKVTGSTSVTITSESAVNVTINGNTYQVAKITDDSKYDLRYLYSQIIGIIDNTGVMATGIVDSLTGITFYAISPLSYSSNSKVSNKEIYPEWFGSKGNNINDDSVAINSAIDIAYYSDSRVIIRKGTYKINDTIVVNNHTYIDGVVPIMEAPSTSVIAVNTDIGVLVFDKIDQSGSYIIKNLGFVNYSNEQNNNYIGIKIYHSQNVSMISNISFVHANIGIDIHALYGVQTLRIKNISSWNAANSGAIAVNARYELFGWFNANIIGICRISKCIGLKAVGGTDNVLDCAGGETNSGSAYLIDIENSTLLVNGGLYNETGRVARLRNYAILKIEGDINTLNGIIDCDKTSYLKYASKNLQTNIFKINNNFQLDNIILKHYRLFPLKRRLWIETVENKIVIPSYMDYNFKSKIINGRLWVDDACQIPIENIDLNGKTVVIRVLTGAMHTIPDRYQLFSYNYGTSQQNRFELARDPSGAYYNFLYGFSDTFQEVLELGEKYVCIPAKTSEYILENIRIQGIDEFRISDIFVLNIDINTLKNAEKIRIINLLDYHNNERDYTNLQGYNTGTFSQANQLRTNAVLSSSIDKGFSFFATDKGVEGLGAIIYYTGSTTTPWVYADGTAVS